MGARKIHVVCVSWQSDRAADLDNRKSTAAYPFNLANSLKGQGKYAEAEKMEREALAARKRAQKRRTSHAQQMGK